MFVNKGRNTNNWKTRTQEPKLYSTLDPGGRSVEIYWRRPELDLDYRPVISENARNIVHYIFLKLNYNLLNTRGY